MPCSRWTRPVLSRMFLLIAAVLATSFPARAIESSPSRVHPHAIYLDAFGRGGLWGLGYDYQLTDRFTLGATGSFYVLDDQRVWSVSPYLGFYPVTSASGHHRWLIQAGPQFQHTSTISPVPEWDGATSTGVSAIAATGYEYRSRFLFRVYGMTAIGKGGVVPWLGISLGWTL